ncbi:MAG: 6-phosphofructokinase [Candidatus Omnitrophota bacterium]
MKRIAVLTSGGDAPGMNACVRSVVRTAVYANLEIFGVMRGYEGLIAGEFMRMDARSVSNIIGKGGTILKTSRSKEFMTKEGRVRAYRQLRKRGIGGLVVIGGNGSFRGAHVLYREHKIKVIGVPGTIDNDVSGSDYTVGCSTALNTALDAIDKIRDTVTSMERIFVVEVMGRKEAYLAVHGGLAGGAEDILFPGNDYSVEDMCDDIKKGHARGKISWIIVVSEGVSNAQDVSSVIHENTGLEVRNVVLGHVQRGGVPVATDRILATVLGAAAVRGIVEGKTDKMVGVESHQVKFVPFTRACGRDPRKLRLEKHLYGLTKIMAI